MRKSRNVVARRLQVVIVTRRTMHGEVATTIRQRVPGVAYASIERLKVFTRNNIRDLFRSQGALFKSSFARAQMVQSPGTVWPSDATRPKRYLDEPPVCSTTWCGCLLCAVRRRLSKVPFVLGTYEAAVIVFSLDIHAFVIVLFRSWFTGQSSHRPFRLSRLRSLYPIREQQLTNRPSNVDTRIVPSLLYFYGKSNAKAGPLRDLCGVFLTTVSEKEKFNSFSRIQRDAHDLSSLD